MKAIGNVDRQERGRGFNSRKLTPTVSTTRGSDRWGAIEMMQTTSGGIVRLNRLEPGRELPWFPAMRNPFRYFNSSPEVIRLAVMMYIRYPLSLRQVEDL